MPLQLLLLRHAKARKDDGMLDDEERPLRVRGLRQVAEIRAVMADAKLRPDLALASPALRTMQTQDALRPLMPPPRIVVDERLYLAKAPALLDTLRAVDANARSVLLIGHNPGMHELAQLLAAVSDDTGLTERLAAGFPTGTLAEFAFDGAWVDIGPRGGRLIRLVIPNGGKADG